MHLRTGFAFLGIFMGAWVSSLCYSIPIGKQATCIYQWVFKNPCLHGT